MSKLQPLHHKIYFVGSPSIISQYTEKFESLGFVLLSEMDSYMTLFDKLQENKKLCFTHKWAYHFDIRNTENANNIILYFVGKYGNKDINEEIVSAVANITLKNISYIDEFEDDPTEKYIKEIYLNYFCGTQGVSAAAPLMDKIVELVRLLSFDRIIINTPLANAVGFYESYGFTKPYVSSNTLQLLANNTSESSGGQKKSRRFNRYKRHAFTRKLGKRKHTKKGRQIYKTSKNSKNK
jgi:hypothetical protein